MYCPGCSTEAAESAKFCKSCGMNLTMVTQALSGGGIVVSDPLRHREYKRARRQISDGIHGTMIGTGLLLGAATAYYFGRAHALVTVAAIAVALAGLVQLFRGVGRILDAKVGSKLVEADLQPKGTGGLSLPQGTGALYQPRASQRLAPPTGASNERPPLTRPLTNQQKSARLPSPEPPAEPVRPPTGRINREHSTPLKKLDKGEDLISNLRN